MANLKPNKLCKKSFATKELLTFLSNYILNSLIFLKQNPGLYQHLVSQFKYRSKTEVNLIFPIKKIVNEMFNN